MTTPIPISAIDAATPTSRSTFRLIAGCVDATNRNADALRHALLAQWTEHASETVLVRRLRQLDQSDPDGAQGVEARLAVWFFLNDPGNGQLVSDDDQILTGLSDELRSRLAATVRPPRDEPA